MISRIGHVPTVPEHPRERAQAVTPSLWPGGSLAPEMTNTSPRPDSRLPSRPVRKLATYVGGSAVAAVSSEATLLLLYGVLGASTAVASVVAWLAGAIPNYWLNRSWTWGRRGRPSLRREVLPYAVVIGLTLLLAIVATRAVDLWLRAAGTSASTRVVLVGATFFGVYVAVFALRFLLLDRLFERLADADHGDTREAS